MKEVGSPNISSETGYWRIPGVLSLQSYYMNISNAHFDSKSSYTPQLGDVAFYIGDATPDFDSSEHAAIVLSYDGTTLVTIGGNEGDDGIRPGAGAGWYRGDRLRLFHVLPLRAFQLVRQEFV